MNFPSSEVGSSDCFKLILIFGLELWASELSKWMRIPNVESGLS